MVKPHDELKIMLADAISMVADGIATQAVCASWQVLKPQVVDGNTTGHHLF